VKGDKDLFSLEKAENAIKQANLPQLQEALDKISAHINKTTDLIASAESDINEAGKVPKQNADALTTELGKKYICACFPVFGWIFAIGILGRLKAFEPAFRSTNQIYQELANALLAKNSKMTKVVMIIGAILGFGGMAAFFALNLGNGVAANVGVPGAVLVFYCFTLLLLITAGKRLRSFLGASAGEKPRGKDFIAPVILVGLSLLSLIFVLMNNRNQSIAVRPSENSSRSSTDQSPKPVEIPATVEIPVPAVQSAENSSRSSIDQSPKPVEIPAAVEIPVLDDTVFSATHRIKTNDGSNLRLRGEPSTTGKQITSLDNGSDVQVLETGERFVDGDGYAGNWMRIRTQNDQTGWCFGAYLTKL
jgi:hypothetical protein